MKRTLRESSRAAARRRRLRPRTAGYLLTFAPRVEFDAAVLYTGDCSDVRAYPDAMPGHATAWEDSLAERRETCALVPV